jgi:hypothetical protein
MDVLAETFGAAGRGGKVCDCRREWVRRRYGQGDAIQEGASVEDGEDHDEVDDEGARDEVGRVRVSAGEGGEGRGAH